MTASTRRAWRILVWVEGTSADNVSTLSAACQLADSVAAPGYYYAPCQDLNNVDNYLQFKEGTTINYKVRVKNTGNINLDKIAYQFSVNGANVSTPTGCSTLPTSIVKGAAPTYCTFTQTMTATSVGSLNDFKVGLQATANASGLSTGTNNVAAIVKVIPRPRLAVNVWASPYRLGGTGNGLAGVASYGTGGLTLNLDSVAADQTMREPAAWLYVQVQNQGGTANNLTFSLTRNASPVSLSSCAIPTSLASYGTTGDTFMCLVPVSFSAVGSFAFAGTATATNSVTVSGTQPNVTVTVATCGSGLKPVPNLVDTLSPTPDGTNKTFSQAKNAWQTEGFDGNNVASSPAGASGSAKVTTSVGDRLLLRGHHVARHGDGAMSAPARGPPRSRPGARRVRGRRARVLPAPVRADRPRAATCTSRTRSPRRPARGPATARSVLVSVLSAPP